MRSWVYPRFSCIIDTGHLPDLSFIMPKRKNKKKAARPMKRGNKKQNSIDMDTQNARTGTSGSDTLTWSLVSGAYPRFGRVGRFDNKIHNVIQMSAPVTLFSTSNTLPTFGVYTFTATNSISQFASWAAVFDQYMIREIEVWVTAATSGGSAINYGNENLYSVNDYDDGNALTSINAVLAYENVIVTPMSNGHYRKWRPHIATAAYSGVFTSFKNEVSTWIDVASPGVQHYGLKLAADVTSTNSIAIKMFTRVWVQFRNVF